MHVIYLRDVENTGHHSVSYMKLAVNTHDLLQDKMHVKYLRDD